MSPYRPRHARLSTRLPDPSGILLAVLTGLTLLTFALVLGGLAAHPFAG